MKRLIEELLEGARERGACGKAQGVDTLDGLVGLYLSPQGQEFCLKHGYPTGADWDRIRREIGEAELRRRGIYVDAGPGNRVKDPGAAVVAVGAGTELTVELTGPGETVARIVALEGARVHVRARGYAVFEMVTDGKGFVEMIEKDETAIEL